MNTLGLSKRLTVIALIALVIGCHKEEGDITAAGMMSERPAPPVTAVAAEARDVPVYLEEIGRTVAVETVAIVPQVDGKIIAKHVEDGAEVKKGQLLFEIDPRPFAASLSSAQALVAQTKAELELAKLEFRRAQDLIDKSAISQLEFDQKKNDVAVAEAKVDAAQAQVEMSALDVEYTKIVSPIDGRAGARLVDAGNVVEANSQPMLNIQRITPIYAEFTITENDLGTVRKYIATRGLDLGRTPEKGLRVEVDIPADSAQVIAALGKPQPATQPTTQSATTNASRRGGPREGTLVFLDNSVTDGSGTVKLRALLQNDDHYFWPGQFVNVRLVLTVKKGAVLVPTQAQQLGQQGPFVFVIDSDSTAKIRPVTLGQRQGDMIVIESGLQAGEKVVVTGQMMIMPGSKVMVTNDAPATPQQASAR